MQLIREGRIWMFGDNVNTDLIFPNSAFRLPVAEQRKLVFSAIRPDWVSQVQPGDLVIGGTNFGTGSGRPVGKVLSECGIAALAADSINGLCMRNCINYSFPALECAGISRLFAEGDRARIDFTTGVVQNLTRGEELQGKALPPFLIDLIESGGIIPMLKRDGYIEDQPPQIATS